MSYALSAGVTGLQAHQKMLDIAGNNLANINTTAFKGKTINFAEVMTETIRKASQPTAAVGGTNPQQLGGGVEVASITTNVAQGNIVTTGNPLDLAIEGEGYFVARTGDQDLYTRAGSFVVDSGSYLVDPNNGYHVQRIGSVGEADGFQVAGDPNIRVPYDVALAANATTEMTLAGNLSADAVLSTPQTNVLTANLGYTTNNGVTAVPATELDQLDQFSGTFGATTTITFSGYKPDGTALVETGSSWVDLTMAVSPTTTLQNVLDYLNTNDGIPVRDEVQTLTRDAQATAGTFTITIGSETTAAIAYDADFSGVGSIKEALEDLDAISDVTVTGEKISDAVTTGETIFTFGDAQGDVGDMTFDFTGCTGPTTAGSSVAETTKGRDAVRGVLGGDATASLVSGKICVTDASSGYSLSDIAMTWADDGSAVLTMPTYFENTTVGGDHIKHFNTTIYDTQGGAHVLSAAFTRTPTANTWDMVLASVTGNVSALTADNRRIRGIEFSPSDGSYSGLDAGTGDTAQFTVTFAHDTANPQTVSIAMGTIGQFDGLTQFAGNSTAVARGQDGYSAGRLATVSVDQEGTIIGAFSNGIKKDIATVTIALFQNPMALVNVGGNYFDFSANSGEPVATQALTGGAGSVRGGALERSNADVATEFVRMIQAQNGFQASARTIRVANDILRELTNIIR